MSAVSGSVDMEPTVLNLQELAREAIVNPPLQSADQGSSGEALPPDAYDFPLDEQGVVDAMARVYGDQMRYVHAWSTWMVWNGSLWVEDEGQTKVHAILRQFLEDAGKTDREGLAAWLKSCRTIKRQDAILRGLQYQLNEKPGSFDADPEILNTLSGIVELRTGRITPHDPKKLCTKICPYEVAEPSTPATKWDTFRLKISNGCQEMADALEIILGYCLLGSNPAQKALILTGQGKNGKSTLLQLVARLLGDYSGTLQPQHLLKQKFGQRPLFGIDAVRGRRFVATSEPDGGAQLDESLFKQITGSRTIQTEAKYQKPQETVISFTLAMDCNLRPGVEWGKAMERRFLILPFDWEVPESERQLEFEVTLAEEEGPQILRRLIDGAKEFYRRMSTEGADRALPETQAMKDAMSEFRAENSPYETFIADCCTVRTGASVSGSVLGAAANKYFVEQGLPKSDTKKLKAALLQRKDITHSRTGQGVVYTGIELQPEPSRAGRDRWGDE